jgi:hypothetical protein
MEQREGSFIGGFLLGFFLQIVGIIISFALGGRNTRRGAGYGMLTLIIISVLFVILFFRLLFF